MNVKGVSWVGDMRQRFDALCEEVDETIYEDTVNYVGNQIRTVKESVKNFYSEVMQDLLASSSRSSIKGKYTVARKGNAVICGKTKIDDSYESVDAEQIPKDSDGWPSSVEEQCTSEHSRSQFADLISNGSTIVENYLSSRQGQGQGQEFICGKSQSERDESLCGSEDISSDEASAEKVRDIDENEGEMSADIIEEYASARVARESQTERTSIGGVSTNVDGADKRGCLNPEESCVLVRKVDHVLTSTLEDGQKSYKKKIKEAFSSKRWSKINKNREQLAVMYEEQSVKSLSGSSTRHTDIQNSQTSESLESEWELL